MQIYVQRSQTNSFRQVYTCGPCRLALGGLTFFYLYRCGRNRHACKDQGGRAPRPADGSAHDVGGPTATMAPVKAATGTRFTQAGDAVARNAIASVAPSRTRGCAEQVRIRQRVAKYALVSGARGGEHPSDDRTEHDPGKAK
ncbi:MAG TPA: hypothetical protein VKK19_15400 [Candidatus Dormibacteraeota bacterium]|nr:hypothetical protein [Candidatus Dormibacteraeota bacterium]